MFATIIEFCWNISLFQSFSSVHEYVINVFFYFFVQRHFCVFAMSFPNQDALSTIYTSILSQHLAFAGFPSAVQKFSHNLVAGALALHTKVSTTFLPTAVKFHYVFNLRDLSNIFQVFIRDVINFIT